MDESEIDRAELELRLQVLLGEYGRDAIFGAPPEGVTCDCGEDGHFHVRVMQAECDSCGLEGPKIDVFAYTLKEGYGALAEWGLDEGWFVSKAANFYLCPQSANDVIGLIVGEKEQT